MSMIKTLKVGQLVRVVSSVKSDEGKTVVSHGCKGHIVQVFGDSLSAEYLIKFPSKNVKLSALEVQSHLKTTKGRPRKLGAVSDALAE